MSVRQCVVSVCGRTTPQLEELEKSLRREREMKPPRRRQEVHTALRTKRSDVEFEQARVSAEGCSRVCVSGCVPLLVAGMKLHPVEVDWHTHKKRTQRAMEGWGHRAAESITWPSVPLARAVGNHVHKAPCYPGCERASHRHQPTSKCAIAQ